MTNKRFWAIVEQIGWGTKTIDYEAIKAELLEVLSVTEAKEMQNKLHEKEEMIRNSLESWEEDTGRNIGLGNDNIMDICAHIVGLGKREWEAAIKNPKIIRDRARANDFEESFSYAIPYDEDFDARLTSYYCDNRS